MTEPVHAGAKGRTEAGAEPADAVPPASAGSRFADLEQRPVAEHVGVFEVEHHRLRCELGSIDRL